MFRRGLRKEQVTLTDDWIENLRVGKLSEGLVQELRQVVERFLEDVRGFLSSTDGPHPRLEYLAKRLEIAAENVAALQDTPPQLRLAFGLASRFYFEGIGYIRYHQEHRPTLKLQAKKVVNPSLVGVWVGDEQACEEYHRMGIPVWYLREVAQAAESKDRFIKSTEPRLYQSRPLWPSDCFRDDGIVRSEPEILKEQTDTSNFLKAVDSWVESKLSAGSR
jgi:hypothetical protein